MIRRILGVALMAGLAAGCGSPSGPKGDAERGIKVHEVCLDCHGTGPYHPDQRKIKSLEGLQKEVARWGDYYHPALSEQDVADVVAYLNRDFYKF